MRRKSAVLFGTILIGAAVSGLILGGRKPHSNQPPGTSVPKMLAVSSEDISRRSIKVSSRLEEILAVPPESLSWSAFQRLKDFGAPELNLAFETITNLSKCRSANLALGIYGDGASTQLLTKALETPRPGEVLSSEETVAISGMLTALGFRARSDPGAFDYLKNACNPHYWDGIVQWVPEKRTLASAIMTQSAIRAVGLSGRPEAIAWLREMKNFPLNAYSKDLADQQHFEGAVVTAAYYWFRTVDLGPDEQAKMFIESRSSIDDLIHWRNTEQGKEWAEWLNQRYRLRGLPEIPIPFPSPQ